MMTLFKKNLRVLKIFINLVLDKYNKYLDKYIEYIQFFLITILIFLYYKHNSKIKEIILFTISFNLLYSLIVYLIYTSKINITHLIKAININIIILALGFIYRTIIFNYFGINIIYYLTLKDYVINVFNLIALGFFIAILFFLSKFIYEHLSYKFPKPSIIKNKIFSIISICIPTISLLFILTPLNIKKINLELFFAFFLSFSFFSIQSIYIHKNKEVKEKFFFFLDNKNVYILLLIINFFINSAFLNLYNIIGYSEEQLIKKGAEHKIYENKNIFKVDSTENYDFYISKPTNDLLIFEKNYNIIKTKKSKD